MTQPTPRIIQRPRSRAVHDAAIALNYTALQAIILAGRLGDAQASGLSRTVSPQAADLDPPDTLPDIDRAAGRLAQAVMRGDNVIPISDHDCDGVSGHSIIRAAMLDVFHHPVDRMHSFIGHRLQEGYGVSDGVVDRIAAAGHAEGVAVSVDCGSSDEPRIARLAQMGIETIVTDHHGVEGSGPPSAFACVNPAREDSHFPDKSIAGCHTAWLTMCATRTRLIELGHLSPDTPSLADLLCYDSLGTVADCVDMAVSRNNRIAVQRGLLRMNHAPRPCWQAFREILGKTDPFTATDIAFKLGPMVNSRGRLDEAMMGVRFLRAPALDAALKYARVLMECNEERKRTERVMKSDAMALAQDQALAGAHGLALWLEEGHSGVHGIVASRVTEALGRPTVCLSPKQGHPELVTGSVRTMGGFHVRNALLRIAQEEPGLMVAHGGHAGAGGLTIRRADIAQFQSMWDMTVREQQIELGPVVLTDGPLPGRPSLGMLSEMAVLAPYGRQFDTPVFSDTLEIVQAREVGEGGAHVKLKLRSDQTIIDGIWFNVDPNHKQAIVPGARRTLAFELDQNTFRGTTSLQLLVRAMA